MKTCCVFHVIDTVSLQLVSTFLAPSLAFAKRQFVQMVDGTKGAISSDFELVEGNTVDIYETYNEIIDEGLDYMTYEECKDES